MDALLGTFIIRSKEDAASFLVLAVISSSSSSTSSSLVAAVVHQNEQTNYSDLSLSQQVRKINTVLYRVGCMQKEHTQKKMIKK